MRPTDTLPAEIERIYSREDFLDYFKICKKAREMWEANRGSRNSISHLESRFSTNGGFNPSRMVPHRAWAY